MHRHETDLSLDPYFISVADEARWNHALSLTAKPDVYFTAAYHRLSEIDSGRRALAYFHQVGHDALFYPFLLAPVPPQFSEERLYDIESCYGYGGPLSTTADPEILRKLWEPYQTWARKQGVVAEVVRFHPPLENQKFASPEMKVLFNRSTVMLDLSGDAEEIWAAYPAKQRNQIRQAQRYGLTCRLGTPPEIHTLFLPVYEQAMAHVLAADRYLFNVDYFDYLAEQFTETMDLLIIEKGREVLAVALFLKGAEIYHYHLSGSLPEARIYRPNNLLLHEAALRAKQFGFGKMHLGGGRTAAPDDPLFKFKASFSDLRSDFHVGETVHLPEAYHRISQGWLQKAGLSERPVPLLFYRIPPPSPS